MKPDGAGENSFNSFTRGDRKAIRLSPNQLIKTSLLDPETQFALLVEPDLHDVNLTSWASANRNFIDEHLLKHGALLFRGFNVGLVSQFQDFAGVVADELLLYHERAAPRIQVGEFVYTSTEYPADQAIPLHHEMSYSHNWPMKLFFFCAQPPQQGGRTPIANDRKVFQLLDPKVKERFLEKGVLYIRNYGEGADLSWQDAFQTTDKSAVEQYGLNSRMEIEWRDKDRLRTRSLRQVVATHPKTGETVWFNHAHMFHVSNLDRAVRDALLGEFKEDELPRNAFYGDGSRIEDSVLEEIRELYRQTAISFDWQKGDVLVLDNFLASHGRDPYAGPRKILVVMAELYTNPDV